MPNPVVRLCWSVSVCAIVALTLVGCGRYQPPSDRPDAHPATTAPGGFTVTRCADLPPIPNDRGEVGVSRSAPDEPIKLVHLSWLHGPGGREELAEFTVRVGDPTCHSRRDVRVWFEPRVEPVRFENARIVVKPGSDRAHIGYTITGGGEYQYTNPGDVRAVRPDGREVRWKVDNPTGGPADISAGPEPMVVEPSGGYYFDASDVEVGETVLVTFKFQSGPVEVPFRVVASG